MTVVDVLRARFVCEPRMLVVGTWDEGLTPDDSGS